MSRRCYGFPGTRKDIRLDRGAHSSGLRPLGNENAVASRDPSYRHGTIATIMGSVPTRWPSPDISPRFDEKELARARLRFSQQVWVVAKSSEQPIERNAFHDAVDVSAQ